MAKGWSFNSQGWTSAKQRWSDFFSGNTSKLISQFEESVGGGAPEGPSGGPGQERRRPRTNAAKRLGARMQNTIKAELSKLASGGDLDIRDAQSWNRQTHPKGPGPSQLVKRIDYDKDEGSLTVTYRDKFKARYEIDDDATVMSFAKADSKGRWALANLWPLPYEKV